MSIKITDLLVKLRDLEKAKKLTSEESVFLQNAIMSYSVNQANDMRIDLLKREVQSVTNINDILNNTILNITNPQSTQNK